MVDVAELARTGSNQIQWDDVWCQEKNLGAFRATATVALLANELLEASIPEPPKKPYLMFLLKYINRNQHIITSKDQPKWMEGMLINFLGQDSPAAGFRFLFHKCGELMERYWGIK